MSACDISGADTSGLKCACGDAVEYICDNCGIGICEDIECGTDTVDGYRCGTYTQWGCARKYTTCDVCLDDRAIHEDDLVPCEKCDITQCAECAEDHECEEVAGGLNAGA